MWLPPLPPLPQTGFLPSVGTIPFDSASSVRGSWPSLACTEIPSGKVPPVGWRCHGESDHQLWLCSRAASRHLAHTTKEACCVAMERKRMGGVQYFAAALMSLLSPNFSSSSAAPSALSTSLASCPSPSLCRSHLAVTRQVLRADSAPKLRSQRNQAERVFKFLTS